VLILSVIIGARRFRLHIRWQFVPSPIRPCKYCGVVVPQFSVGEVAFAAIVRALTNGSKTLAAAELKYYVGCSDHESLVWVEHLRSCLGAWPTASTDEAVIQIITEAFSGIEKPEHFTNFTHCDECKEHDDTLRARTVETLQRKDLGNAGWDPITFCSEEGIAYFFPALARFALLPDAWRDNSWYGAQLLSHLSYEGPANRFLVWCSPAQRNAVYTLLMHMMDTKAEAVSSYGTDDDLLGALCAWNPAT
jgi:hypothetical protein